MWAVRKRFWNTIAVTKYKANRPVTIPLPQDEDRKLEAVGLVRQFPKVPVPNIRVADRVPADEASTVNSTFYDLQVSLYRGLSPMEAGLPSIDADPIKALDDAYTPAHRKCFPAPVLPAEYRGEVELGQLAVASPYACYVERGPDGDFQWDLRSLARYEHHPGLHSLGAEPWSEEYQVAYLEMNHRVFDRVDAVVGEQVWNFADFATTSGIMRVGGNKKGVFTRDRQPKAAAHALRSRWRKGV